MPEIEKTNNDYLSRVNKELKPLFENIKKDKNSIKAQTNLCQGIHDYAMNCIVNTWPEAERNDLRLEAVHYIEEELMMQIDKYNSQHKPTSFLCSCAKTARRRFAVYSLNRRNLYVNSIIVALSKARKDLYMNNLPVNRVTMSICSGVSLYTVSQYENGGDGTEYPADPQTLPESRAIKSQVQQSDGISQEIIDGITKFATRYNAEDKKYADCLLLSATNAWIDDVKVSVENYNKLHPDDKLTVTDYKNFMNRLSYEWSNPLNTK